MVSTAFVVCFRHGGVYAVCKTRAIAEAQMARGQKEFEGETLDIQDEVPMCGWFEQKSPHWERTPVIGRGGLNNFEEGWG